MRQYRNHETADWSHAQVRVIAILRLLKRFAEEDERKIFKQQHNAGTQYRIFGSRSSSAREDFVLNKGVWHQPLQNWNLIPASLGEYKR